MNESGASSAFVQGQRVHMQNGTYMGSTLWAPKPGADTLGMTSCQPSQFKTNIAAQENSERFEDNMCRQSKRMFVCSVAMY